MSFGPVALSALPLSGYLATGIMTVPIGLAGDALGAAAKGVVMVGAAARRATGEAFSRRHKIVRFTVTCRKVQGERVRDRVVKAMYIKREINEINKMNWKCKLLDMEAASVD
ncbi:MAG: hypothetical protein GC196_03440 [Hyphomonas sp.]|nr:hypothetical protein [Hyphomonas sp.]